MPAPSGPTAAVVLIGDEILSGKVDDQNARHAIAELRALGVSLRRIIVVPDEVDEIARAVREASERFDHVFTSGGVGPTHDDVSIEGVARAFGVAVRRDPHLAEVLRDRYGATGAALRMADLPDGTELIATDGLAWPVPRIRNVWILPGVPEIFRRKFDAIKTRFSTAPFHLCAVWTGADESAIAPLLDRVVAEFDAVAVGSYPRREGESWVVRVTLESKDAGAAVRARDRLVALLPEGALLRVE